MRSRSFLVTIMTGLLLLLVALPAAAAAGGSSGQATGQAVRWALGVHGSVATVGVIQLPHIVYGSGQPAPTRELALSVPTRSVQAQYLMAQKAVAGTIATLTLYRLNEDNKPVQTIELRQVQVTYFGLSDLAGDFGMTGAAALAADAQPSFTVRMRFQTVKVTYPDDADAVQLAATPGVSGVQLTVDGAQIWGQVSLQGIGDALVTVTANFGSGIPRVWLKETAADPTVSTPANPQRAFKLQFLDACSQVVLTAGVLATEQEEDLLIPDDSDSAPQEQFVYASRTANYSFPDPTPVCTAAGKTSAAPPKPGSVTIPGTVKTPGSLSPGSDEWNLKAVVTGRQVKLTWETPSVPDGKRLAGYNVYRADSQSVPTDRAHQVNEFALTDVALTDVVTAGHYWYVVEEVYDDGAAGNPSNPVSATVAP